MRTIHKFRVPFSPQPYFTLDLPESFRVVLVGDQNREGWAYVWVELDPDLPRRPVHFRVYGTGHDIEPWDEHCGSWQSGPYVWHLYRWGTEGGR